MSSQNQKERSKRINIDMLLNKYIQGRPYICRASNLSRSGLLLHTVREPNNNETWIGLQFQLPGDDRVITCAGQIVHNRDGASGVQFTSVSQEHQEAIDAFVAS